MSRKYLALTMALAVAGLLAGGAFAAPSAAGLKTPTADLLNAQLTEEELQLPKADLQKLLEERGVKRWAIQGGFESWYIQSYMDTMKDVEYSGWMTGPSLNLTYQKKNGNWVGLYAKYMDSNSLDIDSDRWDIGTDSDGERLDFELGLTFSTKLIDKATLSWYIAYGHSEQEWGAKPLRGILGGGLVMAAAARTPQALESMVQAGFDPTNAGYMGSKSVLDVGKIGLATAIPLGDSKFSFDLSGDLFLGQMDIEHRNFFGDDSETNTAWGGTIKTGLTFKHKNFAISGGYRLQAMQEIDVYGYGAGDGYHGGYIGASLHF